MNKNQKKYQYNWIFICVLIVIELLNEIGEAIFSSVHLFSYTSIFVLLCTLTVFFSTLKVMKKTTKELMENKQKLKNIFDTFDTAIWSHDLITDTLLITPGIEKLYGYSLDDFYHDQSLWEKVIFPEDLPVIAERKRKIALGETVTSEYRIIRPDGEVRWILDRGFPTFDQKGKFVDFNSVLFDITDRKESEERYRSLVEMSPDIIAVTSGGVIDYINETGSKLVGAKNPDEIIGRAVLDFVPPEIFNMFKVKENVLDRNDKKIRHEFQVKRIDGQTIDVEMTATTILIEGRLAKQIVGRDISERKKAEKTIQTMAFYDTLTGLPNRNKFKKHLNKVLNRNGTKCLAVMFLDLDRFKIINDTKGHTVGDLILQKVANRLENSVQQEGLVSRQGGDEFIIVLEELKKERVIEIAKRILEDFSIPFHINGQEFFVTPSIGISLYPSDGQDEEMLIKHADTAMYKAKELGNNYQFYSTAFNGNSDRKMEIDNRLRKAFEQEKLELYYQPQIELKTGKVVGIEALIRWHDSKFGFVSPSEFIPLAEETGLIVPLGKWIIRKACEQMSAWQKAGLQAVLIAVNISVRQFQDDHLIDYISEILDQVGLEGRFLELEITESIMQNIEQSTIILNQLKEIGVLLSVDDFGTGYSSLNYLKHLPIDKIKIDKSFVDDILYHSNQGMMVKTIIDMGNNLQFTVIAEGIETEEQVQFLQDNHCEVGQGYFYSKPVPAKEMAEYIRKKSGVSLG